MSRMSVTAEVSHHRHGRRSAPGPDVWTGGPGYCGWHVPSGARPSPRREGQECRTGPRRRVPEVRELTRRAAALFCWAYAVWVLLTWTRTAEQLLFGAGIAA